MCRAQNIKFDFLCLRVLEVAHVRLHVKYASMRCTLFDFYFPPLESPAIYKHFYYYYFRRAKEEGKEQGTYTVCLRFVQVCQLLQNLALHIRHTHTRTHTHTHTHTHICVVDFYQIYEGAQMPHTKAHSTGTKKYPTSPLTHTHTVFVASGCTLSRARFARARQHTHQHTHTHTYILKMLNSYAPSKRESLQS